MEEHEAAMFTLIPNHQLGPFAFGTSITLYIDKHGLKTDGCPILLDGQLHQAYIFQDDGGAQIRIRCDHEELIESIECFTTLKLDGVNLIGKAVSDIEEIVGLSFQFDDEIIELDGKPYRTAFNDELGIQLWLTEDAVESIHCFDGTE